MSDVFAEAIGIALEGIAEGLLAMHAGTSLEQGIEIAELGVSNPRFSRGLSPRARPLGLIGQLVHDLTTSKPRFGVFVRRVSLPEGIDALRFGDDVLDVRVVLSIPSSDATCILRRAGFEESESTSDQQRDGMDGSVGVEPSAKAEEIGALEGANPVIFQPAKLEEIGRDVATQKIDEIVVMPLLKNDRRRPIRILDSLNSHRLRDRH